MKFKETLFAEMAEYLRKCGVPDVATVVAFEQDTRGGGYCNTCYWEEIIVEIRYRTGSGDEETYTYSGDLGELVRALTD